jgi:hypothetical protein
MMGGPRKCRLLTDTTVIGVHGLQACGDYCEARKKANYVNSGMDEVLT